MSEVKGGRLSLLLVGVGGQGVLTAARILGDAAHSAGIPVVVGQLHGMAQRGGSVECSVLLGPGRSSFLSAADVVVGFEALETVRARERIGRATRVLVNAGQIMPSELSRNGSPYPPFDQILGEIRKVSSTVVPIDGPSALREVNEPRTLNIVMLGGLSALGWIPCDEVAIWNAVARRCPAKYSEANRRAFEIGRALAMVLPRQSEDT